MEAFTFVKDTLRNKCPFFSGPTFVVVQILGAFFVDVSIEGNQSPSCWPLEAYKPVSNSGFQEGVKTSDCLVGLTDRSWSKAI
jgi:hypothetical protein